MGTVKEKGKVDPRGDVSRVAAIILRAIAQAKAQQMHSTNTLPKRFPHHLGLQEPYTLSPDQWMPRRATIQLWLNAIRACQSQVVVMDIG